MIQFDSFFVLKWVGGKPPNSICFFDSQTNSTILTGKFI